MMRLIMVQLLLECLPFNICLGDFTKQQNIFELGIGPQIHIIVPFEEIMGTVDLSLVHLLGVLFGFNLGKLLS